MSWCRNCVLQQIRTCVSCNSPRYFSTIIIHHCPIPEHPYQFNFNGSSSSPYSTHRHSLSLQSSAVFVGAPAQIMVIRRLHTTSNNTSISSFSRRCLLSSMSKFKWFKNCQSTVQTNCKMNFISLPGAPVKKKEFAERRIIGFSMEQMFDVVSDVDNYIHFLPWCESSIVKSKSSTQIVADLVIGMKPVTESYTSVVTMKRPLIIRAESKHGGKHFSHMMTNWKFSPGLKGKPKSCLIDFYVSFEFRSSFHSQLANIFFNEVVKAMANAFYVEAQKRYGQESIPPRKVALIPAKSKSNDDNLP